MLCIKENVKSEIVIKNSKFICFLYRVDNIEDVKKYIDEIKKVEKGATHYCYAYIIDNIKRFNDDKEPSGTAGMPILNILESNNLNHILAVVVRYFGGIKLGAAGLLRAYANSVTESVNASDIIKLITGKIIEITFPYSDEKKINSLNNIFEIIDKKYDSNIHYIVFIPDFNMDKLENIEFNILEENVLGKEKKA